MKGEPEWMIESALKQKRQELMGRWEERERKLRLIREREKELEERAMAGSHLKKRQKLGGDGHDYAGNGRGKKKDEVDEEREFLIGDWDGGASGEGDEDDPLFGLSRETREMLEQVGLGLGTTKRGGGEEEGEVEDEIKVCCLHAVVLRL